MPEFNLAIRGGTIVTAADGTVRGNWLELAVNGQ